MSKPKDVRVCERNCGDFIVQTRLFARIFGFELPFWQTLCYTYNEEYITFEIKSEAIEYAMKQHEHYAKLAADDLELKKKRKQQRLAKKIKKVVWP